MSEKREVIGTLFINTTKKTGDRYLKGSLTIDGKVTKVVGFYKEKVGKEGAGETKYFYLVKDVPLPDKVEGKKFTKADDKEPF